MAFKTISKNQQRWASYAGKPSKSKGKKKKPFISKWVRNFLRKEDRRKEIEHEKAEEKLNNPSSIQSAQKVLTLLDEKKIKRKNRYISNSMQT